MEQQKRFKYWFQNIIFNDPLTMLGLIGIFGLIVRVIVMKKQSMSKKIGGGEMSFSKTNGTMNRAQYAKISNNSHTFLTLNVVDDGGLEVYEGNIIKIFGKSGLYLAVNPHGYFEFWDQSIVQQALDDNGQVPTLYAKSKNSESNNFWFPLTINQFPVRGVNDQIMIYDWKGQIQVVSARNGKFWISTPTGSKWSDEIYYIDDKKRKRKATIIDEINV